MSKPPELLKDAEIPQSIRVELVRAKDGRPYFGDDAESSCEKDKDTGEEDKAKVDEADDSGKNSEDPDDLSFLD